ncbi:hypothetical protein PHYSODRAFT_527753 [Phytophthora sojae]|uniref:Uncharacterized protein n=1 Tax=Phytophthora sojae (strain P6497) TaxID=1094619 RepID=G5A8V0_PHYSP|nr:hypothetical protein PHYSODRAFT_527753 [Phytophthora sojae]EGZ08326.1 hypothetical protein PHYSODRAFT_527753 [Phytophthora sojae]|eukprot:XP_009536498.1 hypothetical protein PHYSODRAFT_527753 [Phytophthora sojae]
MGSMQKVYSRLNLPLPYDPNIRGRRICNVFRMANYRVRTVGISEIRRSRAKCSCRRQASRSLAYDGCVYKMLTIHFSLSSYCALADVDSIRRDQYVSLRR